MSGLAGAFGGASNMMGGTGFIGDLLSPILNPVTDFVTGLFGLGASTFASGAAVLPTAGVALGYGGSGAAAATLGYGGAGAGAGLGYMGGAGAAGGGGFMSGMGAMFSNPMTWIVGLGALIHASGIFGDDNANSRMRMWTGDQPQGGKFKSGFFSNESEWSQVMTPFGTMGAAGRHIGVAADEQIPQEEFDKWLAGMTQLFTEMGKIDQVLIDTLDVSGSTIDTITKRIEALDYAEKKMGSPDVAEFIVDRYSIVFEEIGGLANTMFQNFKNEGLDEDTVFGAVQTIIALTSAVDGLKNISEEAAITMEMANMTQVEQLEHHRNSVYDLIDAYDGTLASTQGLVAGLEQQRQGTIALLAAIKQISEGIAGTFANTREKILTDLMTDEQKFNYYKEQADTLMASMATMTDPAKIAKNYP